MNRFKQKIVLFLATALTFNFVNFPIKTLAASEPSLLITELMPNTKNANSADAYEFIELYNNSQNTINAKDYKLIYHYDDSNKDIPWDITSDVQIPAKTSFIVWVDNGSNSSLTTTDFKSAFNIPSTVDDKYIIKMPCGGGMSNSSPRTIHVQKDDNTEISSASYVGSDASDDTKSVHYKYSGSSTAASEKTIGIPSPSSLSSEEGTTIQKDVTAPVITHTKIADISDTTKDVTISAVITDDNKVVTTKLYYKNDKDTDFKSVDLSNGEKGNFSAVIPVAALTGKSITYYIEASDGTNTAKTEQYSVNINNSGTTEDSKQPPLLITELVPDSKTNLNGSDAYEFIEIYNNTDKDIDLKDYKIHYNYPDKGDSSDILWPSTPDSVIIPSGKPLVLWIMNGNNDSLTVEDFNKYYNSSLIANKNIVQIHSAGMANSGARGIKIDTNTGMNLVKALYDMNGADDVDPDQGIQYGYNAKDPYNLINKGKNAATPGTVLDSQVPVHRLHISEDSEVPYIKDKSAATIDPKVEFNFNADITDNASVKTAALYLKSNVDSDYTKYNLTVSSDGTFQKILSSSDVIGKKYFDYYFEASDGINTAKTKAKHLVIENVSTDQLRLNVDNTFIAKGTVPIRASEDTYPSSAKLTVSGQDVTSLSKPGLEKEPVFVFDVTQTDTWFKNGVTIGNDILSVFDDGTYSNWKTMSIPVSNSYFQQGKPFKININAGTKSSPLEHYDGENNDDFQVKNIRLILPDGRELRCTGYEDPNKLINMGDSAGKSEVLDCNFNVPDDAYKAVEYQWDTTKVSDGNYSISAVDGSNSAAASIKVDNTAPEITTNMISKQYKGDFSIEASAVDVTSGLKSLNATLDGERIVLPYKTSSVTLKFGNHILKLEAEDNVGNTSEKTINFKTPVENPDKPELISPIDGTKLNGNNATLTAKVSDPTQDNMTVNFKKGYKYTVADKEITVKSGAVDYHPVDGSVVTGSDLGLLKNDDGKELTNKSTDKFPYHIFEVKVPEDAGNDSVANVSWKGSSNANSKLAMYVWNYTSSIWEPVVSHIVTDDKEFELNADVNVKDRVSNGTVKVLVQEYMTTGTQSINNKNTQTNPNIPTGNVNDTPRSDYDFTLAWETDTQYYNATWYQHQLDIHNWLLANKDRMNIKYLFHTGDIVDDSTVGNQWQNADNAYKMLDQAGFPYGVLAGNHDVGQKNNDFTDYSKYFGEDRYKNNPWYGGDYQNNRGHYDLISAGGIDFIMIYMSWAPGDDEIAWVNSVLKQYPNRKAILNFHEYLEVTGGLGPIPQRIQNEIVKPNPNVCMVFSGHYHSANQVVTQYDDNGDGVPERKVHQILFDYQGLTEGGLGYLRLLHFDLKDKKIIFRTYSPSLDDYDANVSDFPVTNEEFEVPFQDLGLSPKEKEVSTDYVKVNLYTNNKIGEVQNVKSGSEVTTQWNNIPQTTAGWYAEAADAFGGITRSEVNYVTGSEILKGVTITADNTTLERTKTAKLSVKGKLNDNSDADLSKATIQYTSSNPSIVSVDGKGVITANKVGSADITAVVTLNGTIVQSNAMTITVNEINMGAVNLGINPDKSLVGAGEELQVKLNAKAAKNLYGLDSTFSYDPSLFELESVTVDKDFATDSGKAYVNYKDDNGRVRIVTSLTGATQGVTGDANVIDIKLKAKNKDGKTSFTIAKGAKVSDSQGAIFTTPEDISNEITVANADVTGGGIAINDLVLVARAFGITSKDQGYNAAFDMNKDGVIDIVDISYVAKKVLGL
jgi:hypothetical protein